MKHYLLFNGNCETCSQIAKELEKVSDGWLEIKSLNDPSIRAYLDINHPNWSWGPMIVLENNQGDHKVLTGARMKSLLVRKLGIKKAFKVAHLIHQLENSLPQNSVVDLQRRAFLKTSIPSFVGALIALNFPRALDQGRSEGVWQASRIQSEEDNSELYHGFVLLPAIDSTTPSYVLHPPTYTRSSVTFASEKELREAVPFGLYKLNPQHNHLPLLNAQKSILEGDGTITGATINYGELAFFSKELTEDRVISLIVHNEGFYPTPCPIRPVHEFDPQKGIILRAVEKIQLGRLFGLILPSSNGYVAHWIRKGVLYTLAVEDSPSKERMMQILTKLEAF